VSGVNVTRRSALETTHARLGAVFVSDTIRWPLSYGDDAAEARAVTSAAGLAELGPFAELLLRGPEAAATAAAVLGASIPDRPAAVPGVSLDGTTGTTWSLGPDEVLLVGPIGGWAAALERRLAGPNVSAIEMTGARTVLGLAGPAAPAILAELCPVDTTPATMAEGDLIQAPLAGPRAFIARRDAAGTPGYTIMVARDEAAYVWDSLVHVGAAHGLVPVGPAAMGGAE
jgi:aminomethyltransferase